MTLRTKFLIIVGVISLSVWSFYPPGEKVKLGLDLKGGVHLVLRVHTDDALRIETELTVERLRETLAEGGLEVGALSVTSPTEFLVEEVQPAQDQAFRQAASDDSEAVFNRSSGAGNYTYSMKPNIANQLREEAVAQALQTIERRVNELGVAEPVVAKHGSGNQILVQLPGVSEVARAKEIIRSTAQLELKLVEQGPFYSRDDALQAVGGETPGEMELVSGSEDVSAAGGGVPSTL